MRFGHGLDYYLRSVTTALLALGIVSAAIYSVLTGSGNTTALIGWAGIVVGVYFGTHATLNGQRTRRDVADQTTDDLLHRVAHAEAHVAPDVSEG